MLLKICSDNHVDLLSNIMIGDNRCILIESRVQTGHILIKSGVRKLMVYDLSPRIILSKINRPETRQCGNYVAQQCHTSK